MNERPTAFAGVHRFPPAPLATALVLSVALSVGANFFLFGSAPLNALMRWSQGLVNGTLVANLGMILIVLVLCLGVWGGARGSDMGLRRRDLGRAMCVTFATWLCLNALALVASLLAGQGVHSSTTFENAWTVRATAGEWLGQLFGNALYEEVLFRGVLLIQLGLWLSPERAEPTRRKTLIALFASQAIFALQHIPNRLAFGRWGSPADIALDMTGLFASGLFLAGVFLRTRNLLLAVGMHTLINLPTLLVAAPEWTHPVGIGVALLTVMAIGPRLSRA